MTNSQNEINLQEMNDSVLQMTEEFMQLDPKNFKSQVAQRISDACGVDGWAVITKFYAGAKEFETAMDMQKQGMTLYDRLEQRDEDAGCDKEQRKSNRNRDIVYHTHLLQMMRGKKPDKEDEEVLQMNTKYANLEEEEQKALLNELNEKTANLGAQYMLAEIRRHPVSKMNACKALKENTALENKRRYAVSCAAATYIETMKQAKNVEEKQQLAKGIDAKVMGFMSAAGTEAQAAIVEAGLLAQKPGAEYDKQIEEAKKNLDEVKASTRAKCEELEQQLQNADDGEPKIGRLQKVLTAISGIIVGFLAAKVVFEKLRPVIMFLWEMIQEAELFEAIITWLGLAAVTLETLFWVVLAFVVVAVGVYIVRNILIQAICKAMPEGKRKLAEAEKAKAALEAAIDKAKAEGKADVEKAEQALQILIDMKHEAEQAPMAKAKAEADEVLEKSKMTIFKRMLDPCRKAMAGVKSGVKVVSSVLGIGKKDAVTTAEKIAEPA